MTIRPAGAMPDVSIVIPVYNKLELTRTCVESIHAQGADCTFEIIIVDNGSSDGTGDWLEAQEAAGRVRAVANPDNLGFSRGCNLGASHARGRYILFLNNDMEVLPGWLEPLVWTLDNDPDVGVVGARLLFPDGTIQHAGVAVVDYTQDKPPVLGGQHKSYKLPHDDPEVLRPQLMQVVTGACLLIRPEVYTAIGGFDEGYWNGNEDVDLCLMAGEAGWLVAYRPESAVIHYESQSGPERFARMVPNIQRFTAKWRGRARPDFLKYDCQFHETPDSAIRLYAPPRQLYLDRRRGWPAEPGATIIVVPRGGETAGRRAAAALASHTDPRHAVIALGDGGTAAVNEALGRARSDAVVLLGSDVEVTRGWLDRLLTALGRHPRVGLAGPRTNARALGQAVADAPDPDVAGALEAYAAALAGREGDATIVASRLGGFCLALRRAVVERIGGLDDRFGGLDGAAIDLGMRAVLGGFSSEVAAGAYVHVHGAGEPAAVQVADSALLRTKWPLSADRDGELRALLARGFLPPLHFEPLPPGPGHRAVEAGYWEADAWVEAGEEAFAAGRLPEALRLFRAALDLRPDDSRAANDLAVTLLQMDPGGRGADLARALFRRVLAREPGNADAAWNLQELEASSTC